MDILVELIKITLPAALVLYAVYLVVKAFLNKEFERRITEINLKNTEQITQIRLQAYERICLFLERIRPANLLVRISPNELNSNELHHVLLQEIRNEYSHNLSQQVYMSNNAWEIARKAKEDVITLINNSKSGLEENSKGIVLAKRMLENMQQYDIDPCQDALNFIKNEIRQDLFFKQVE